jgi:hypothetical protein
MGRIANFDREALQGFHLEMRFGKEDLFILHLDEIEHGFLADHPLFEDLDCLLAGSTVHPILNEPPQKPIGEEEERDQGDQGEDHFHERRYHIVRGEGRCGLGDRRRQSNQIPPFIWNENRICEEHATNMG